MSSTSDNHVQKLRAGGKDDLVGLAVEKRDDKMKVMMEQSRSLDLDFAGLPVHVLLSVVAVAMGIG